MGSIKPPEAEVKDQNRLAGSRNFSGVVEENRITLRFLGGRTFIHLLINGL